jgi:hypothetical protein
MKKIIALSSILLGIVFLTGCSLQPLKKNQPTTSAPIVEQPLATTTPQIDETADWKIYTDSKVGFTFKYPANANISGGDKKDSGLTLRVSVSKLDSTSDDDAPLGYDSANFLKDRAALSKGDPSTSFGQAEPSSLKMLSITNALAKEYIIFRQLEVCDVQFNRQANIYKDDYLISLDWTYNGSAIQNNNPSYFKIDSKNCGSYGMWKDYRVFYTDLVAGKTDSVSQNWFTSFDEIISTFKFTEQSTTTNETANWKTYTNKKYSFEIKYPKEATVSTYEKAIGTNGIVYIGSRNKSIDHGVTYDVEYGITFQDLGSANNMSAENWYSQYYQSEKQYAAKADMPMFLSASGKNVKLNGYDAYETSDFNSDSSLINFYIAHNGIIYRISYRGEIVQNVPKWPEFEKIINQMLSTFKFTK